ncbi:hypothetical protein LTR70_008201 [Exophiala xenobiotica]|nr:hypothetical protein LTR70_008201 [Exophiala xenobiotica]
MARLTTLPPEILRDIVSHLNPPKLSKDALTVFQARNVEPLSTGFLQIPEDAEDLDLSAFQPMRTCKSLRDFVLDVMWDADTTNYTPHQLDKLVYKTFNQEHNARYWIRIAEATKEPRAEFKNLKEEIAREAPYTGYETWMHKGHNAINAVVEATGKGRLLNKMDTFGVLYRVFLNSFLDRHPSSTS